ncbi:MAG TPA: TetR/AcrR family transcriptional regulator [Pseudoduganella sp.]|jgi:TetR/AcrR family transcriptional repressor of mexCD-oprJ operon
MTNDIDDKLARSLAMAVTRYPRANLQQLARAAGISKATLYRLARTRDSVVELLVRRAERHMREALALVDRPGASSAEALLHLTEYITREPEFYLFWQAALWINLGEMTDEVVSEGYAPSFFSDRLERFFLDGQQSGAFRIDMPARWLAKSYDFLLYAAMESAQRGEIATLGMTKLVHHLFSTGALANGAAGGQRNG